MARHSIAGHTLGIDDVGGSPPLDYILAPSSPAGEARGGYDLARRGLFVRAGAKCQLGALEPDCFDCRRLRTGGDCVNLDRGDRRARTRSKAGGTL